MLSVTQAYVLIIALLLTHPNAWEIRALLAHANAALVGEYGATLSG